MTAVSNNEVQSFVDSKEPIYVSKETLQQIAAETVRLFKLIQDSMASESDLTLYDRYISIISRLVADSN